MKSSYTLACRGWKRRTILTHQRQAIIAHKLIDTTCYGYLAAISALGQIRSRDRDRDRPRSCSSRRCDRKPTRVARGRKRSIWAVGGSDLYRCRRGDSRAYGLTKRERILRSRERNIRGDIQRYRNRLLCSIEISEDEIPRVRSGTWNKRRDGDHGYGRRSNADARSHGQPIGS